MAPWCRPTQSCSHPQLPIPLVPVRLSLSFQTATLAWRSGPARARLNVERQLNFVDTFAWTVGVHQFKFGIDYRRINSTAGESDGWFAFDLAYKSIVAGTTDIVFPSARDPISISMNNYSLFGQDTWRATHHLTLTYGLRWEINTPPESATSGEPLYATQGIFDSNPLAVVPGALWHR